LFTSSYLARPPALDSFPTRRSSDLNDWRDNPHRTAEQITADVMSHLPPCTLYDQRCGNIILLHDGGGDRRETVRALPMIIEGIRDRKSTRLNSSHQIISYAVFCLNK